MRREPKSADPAGIIFVGRMNFARVNFAPQKPDWAAPFYNRCEPNGGSFERARTPLFELQECLPISILCGG